MRAEAAHQQMRRGPQYLGMELPQLVLLLGLGELGRDGVAHGVERGPRPGHAARCSAPGR
ncbi:hypothetical protein [Streptomyces sp. F001]|uniref:hypothetical protein n=1 Tax=Streptomyces sp. F001 TaxID=1510026 RepID=UPI001F115F9E|nr:hypothetical protein [Streptomyces sp. F001]